MMVSVSVSIISLVMVSIFCIGFVVVIVFVVSTGRVMTLSVMIVLTGNLVETGLVGVCISGVVFVTDIGLMFNFVPDNVIGV